MPDGLHEWLMIASPDMFRIDDLRAVASQGVFLNVAPRTPNFDLARVPGLDMFTGIRISVDGKYRLGSLEIIQDLRRLTYLESRIPIPREVDLSDLVSLTTVNIKGQASESTLGLPRLTTLGVELEDQPPEGLVQAHVTGVYISARKSLKSLKFIARPDLVEDLVIVGSDFDMAWLADFSSLEYMEIIDAGVLTATSSSLERLGHLSGITLTDVARVNDLRSWWSLPKSVFLTVEGNHTFPPKFVSDARRSTWRTSPYSGSADDENKEYRNSSAYYPFAVNLSESPPEVTFAEWTALERHLADRNLDHSTDLGAYISAYMFRAARDLDIAFVDDSEAQEARLVVESSGDAIALAERLTASWRSDSMSDDDSD